MILLTTSAARLRTSLGAALLGGLAGGALVPQLTLAAGPVAARAAFAAIAAALILIVRGTDRAPARVAIAAGFGAGAAHLEKWLPMGFAPALVGLGIALVIAPEGKAGAFARILRGASGAAGALLAAIGVGALAATHLGSSAVVWDATLGTGIALGAMMGELLHSVLHVSTRPPAELDAARTKLLGDGRATVDMARAAYVRACEAVCASSLGTADRVEALTTARDLAVTAARASLQADEVARAKASVNAGPAGSDEVRETRERVTEQLSRKLAKARDDASRAATALAEIAIAIAERGATQDTAATELATRARGLAVRIHAPADPVAALKS